MEQAPGQEAVYLVGTEEGAVHKCSKAYSSEVLATYGGHAMAVYAVRWNCLHPRTFLSASADWTVCVWDSGTPAGAAAGAPPPGVQQAEQLLSACC